LILAILAIVVIVVVMTAYLPLASMKKSFRLTSGCQPGIMVPQQWNAHPIIQDWRYRNSSPCGQDIGMNVAQQAEPSLVDAR